MNTRRSFVKTSAGGLLAFGAGIALVNAWGGNRIRFSSCSSSGDCFVPASGMAGYTWYDATGGSHTTAALGPDANNDWCKANCTADNPMSGAPVQQAGWAKCDGFGVMTWCQG